MSNPSLHNEWHGRLRDLAAQDRLRSLKTIEPLPGHRVLSEKQILLNLASNDYLGLGCDLGLHEAFLAQLDANQALAERGFTASASRLMSGNHPACSALEHMLEDAYGNGRRALILNSGYHANLGILPALARRGDLILSDRLNHASLIDGIRLSRANWRRYRHGDIEHLKTLLAAHRPRAGRRIFIVTESIFSMDGDCADLQALTEIKHTCDAVLFVDEAHAVGVRGKHGLGLCEEAGILPEVDVMVGAFGKALASTGAFTMTTPLIRDILVNCMRPLIYTTALPPVILNWTRHVFQHGLEARERRARLAENTALFRRELARANRPAPGSSHIVPLIVGADNAATALAQRLRQAGYLVPPIRPPTVPAGTARLRFSLCAGMQPRQLTELAALAGRLQMEMSA